MRRPFAFLISFLILVSAFPTTLYAKSEKPIEVYFHGKKLEFAVQPVNIKNNVLVQMRPIFEAMEYGLFWNEQKRTITAAGEKQVLNLTIGSLSASNTGFDHFDLAVAPCIIHNSTMVPLRFVAEASGYQVDWEEANNCVRIEYSNTQKESLAQKRTAIANDLAEFKETLLDRTYALEKSHRGQYNFPKDLNPPDDLESQLDQLIASVPTMSIKDIEFSFLNILNYIGDPNTSPYNFGAPLQPLRFEVMSDGIYLMDAASNYESVVGKKLTAINGVPIDKVIEKLEPLLPDLNKGWREYALCNMLSKSGYLYVCGIINCLYQPVSYTFDKEKVSSLFTNILYYRDYVSVSDNQPVLYPVSYELLPEKNWVQVLPDKQAVYAKLNTCGDWEGYTIQDFIDEITQAGKQSNIKTLILDLRDNQGGSSDVIPLQLSRALKTIDKFTKPGGFYILSGRNTRDIGVAGIYFLQSCNPIVVGQPSRWDHCYTGSDQVTIPSLRCIVNLSKFYFEMSSENGITDPDILVTPTAAAFFAGRDECIEAAIADRDSK